MDSRPRLFPSRLPFRRRFYAVIHGIANQVNQGIVQLIDYGLVQLGIGALDGELHFFAQFHSEIVHQPPKSFEGGFQRQHANTHGALPQCRRQTVDRLGNIQNIGVAPPRGHLAQACLHRHQFAHQVDQLIQFFGGYADAGGWPGRPGICLAARRRRQLDRLGCLRVRLRGRFDRQCALVFDKDEDVPDRFYRRRAGQHDVPAQVAALRIHPGKRWDCRRVHRDSRFTQIAQLAEQEEGIGPVQQNIGAGLEADMPIPQAIRPSARAALPECSPRDPCQACLLQAEHSAWF